MKAIPWKKLLPVFAALALFYTLSLLYFSPMLEGKQLVQGDRKQWQGMAREIEEHRELTGREPLWTGSMFGGMPAYQIAVDWAPSVLHAADRLFHGFLPRPASFLFLYLLGMFVLLWILRVYPWLCIVGAVAFGFSSYFFIILEAGHNNKAHAIGYMPMVLGGLWMLYRGRMWVGGALLALFLALEVAMNHVQVTYYLGLLLLFFVLAEAVRFIREGRLAGFAQRSGIGIIAVGIALVLNAGLLYSTWEYGKYTTRGASELTVKADGSPADDIRTKGLDRDYVTDWSYGVQESFTLLVPDAKGGATSLIGNDPALLSKSDPRFRQNVAQMNRYWGDQRFTSGPVYLGAIVVLLMLLMLAQAEARARWWALAAVPVLLVLLRIDMPALAFALLMVYLLAGLALWKDTLAYALFSALVLTLVLSWGRNYMPLTDFFLDHVPGYDKFRAVTIILVIVELAAPLLGILYLDRLVKQGGLDKTAERRSIIVMGGLVAMLLLMALAPGAFFDFLSTQERDAFAEQMDARPGQEAMFLSFINGMKEVRMAIFTADVWRSLAFVLAAAVLLLLFGRKVIGAPVLIGGIGVLMLADLWTVDKRYIHNEKAQGRYEKWEDRSTYDIPHKPNAADLAILEEGWTPAAEAAHAEALERLKQRKAGERGRNKVVSKEEDAQLRFAILRRHAEHRVLTLANPFNDGRVSYFHRSLGGYHGAKLKRYQELIEFHLGPAIQRVGGLLQTGTSLPAMDSLLAREGVLNMLNAGHLIYSAERPPIRNLNALGHAWFVQEVRFAKDADEEITLLGTLDPAVTVLVHERDREAFGPLPSTVDPGAMATLDRYETDRLTYTVRSNTGGAVVFSEMWYGPDWKAYLDGQPVDHQRVDYVLRGLVVPPGEHEVVFKLESQAYALSGTTAMAGGALLLLWLGLAAWGLWRRRDAAA